MANINQDKVIQALQEQQAHWFLLASKAMENSMKLVELNVRIAKESIVDSSHLVQQLFCARSPEDVLWYDAEKLQFKLNRVVSYVKEFNEITAGFNTELRNMTHDQLYEACVSASKLMESGYDVKPAHYPHPLDGGSGAAGYGQWMQAGKKLAETVEHNLVQTVANTVDTKNAAHTKAGATSGKRKSTTKNR